jgi:hypothetical protein
MERTPNRLLKWFRTAHLPQDLAFISSQIGHIARDMDVRLNESAEKTAGLRKLLEAKDCFVRAAIEDREAAEKVSHGKP